MTAADRARRHGPAAAGSGDGAAGPADQACRGPVVHGRLSGCFRAVAWSRGPRRRRWPSARIRRRSPKPARACWTRDDGIPSTPTRRAACWWRPAARRSRNRACCSHGRAAAAQLGRARLARVAARRTAAAADADRVRAPAGRRRPAARPRAPRLLVALDHAFVREPALRHALLRAARAARPGSERRPRRTHPPRVAQRKRRAHAPGERRNEAGAADPR